MAIIKVDFSRQARDYRAMLKQLRREKSEPLTLNQKVFYYLHIQHPYLQTIDGVR